MTFDLRDEKWIPCILPDGRVCEVGVRNALVHAHEFAEMRCDSPLATAALLRLLLAAAYQAFGPEELGEWAELWNADRLPEDRINVYLDGDRCRDRFDLFSVTRPFLQVGGMTMKNPTPLAALATEAATGNNPTLFNHASDDDLPAYSPAEAARMLVAAQAFALGFGKAAEAEVNGEVVPRPYLGDAICLRGVTLFLSGGSLRETLLLNLPPESRPAADAPAWERDDPTADMDKVSGKDRRKVGARGPADRYAWLSRMARLLPEADGRVRQVYFTQGRMADKDRGDPMKLFVTSKKEGEYALGLSAEKAAWRDLQSYLSVNAGGRFQNTILDHIAEREDEEVIPKNATYGLNVIGLATDPGKAGKFLLWRHDRVSLPAAILADPNLVGDVESAIDAAEFTAWELGGRIRKAASRFLPPEGNPDPKDVDKLSQSLDIRPVFWSHLERRFAAYLHEMSQEGNGMKERDKALERWRRDVEAEAGFALREACDQLGHSARAIRATADVSFYFLADRQAVMRQIEEAKKRKRKGAKAA
jgi:CRISPR system Cascade subunit CasA